MLLLIQLCNNSKHDYCDFYHARLVLYNTVKVIVKVIVKVMYVIILAQPPFFCT